MKKILLLFIFLLLNGASIHAQNDYGVLVKTILYPKKPYAVNTVFTIEGKKDNETRFTTGNMLPLNEEREIYNFYYVTDINKISFFSYEQYNTGMTCSMQSTNQYDIRIATEDYFDGCLGYSNVYTIHLNQPENNNVCADEIITLYNGWNYEYRYSTGNWTPLPAQYQAQTAVHFKLTDLTGYEGKSQIFFRAGYQNNFTNVITYNIIGCSPELNGDPVAVDTKCIYQSNGGVELKFKSELKDNNRFLFNIFYDNTPPEFIKSLFVSKGQITNNTFFWDNLATGTYIIKYQAQSLNDTNENVGLSAITTKSFTIGNPTPLKFETKAINTGCDEIKIQISASGGTKPYYYYLGNETIENKHRFESPYIIPNNMPDGDYKITVIDSKECIEKPEL
ncbi:hypothetical protein [Flavobacterium quisquiliarum]|uniref:SprB repeat-containing protein n=1 Tax=Flavobacterium quisquiliarum TaxID=1834436 RepID=A0ABV8W8P9_9FLAO|nr:hypothetical protein [Flavobacterium quisquiliarum]MBW1656228.1 hypothetical protein [Flavobacterium quisquiliarum]NWL02071.1 hypothetical protein [Flavobacterium collinsii]